MARLAILKNLIKSPVVHALGAGGLGYGVSELENKYIYENPGTKDISRVAGGLTGLIAGALFKNPKTKPIALHLLGSYAGPKQLALLGIDKFNTTSDKASGYFDAVKKREEQEKEIRELTLDTAKETAESARNLNESTKYLADTFKTAFPAIGGLSAAFLSLYAYNSFKQNKEKELKQNISVKLDDANKNKNFYLEIPSEKISDKFYNTLGREILFKHDAEKAKAKEEAETSTKKAASFKLQTLNIPKVELAKPREPLNKYFYKKHGDVETLAEIEKRYPNLSPDEHLAILGKLQQQNTQLLPALLDRLGIFLTNKTGLAQPIPQSFNFTPKPKQFD